MLPWARLNAEGFLEMFRCGSWKRQYCHNTGDSRRCGDWCPLFRNISEPIMGKHRAEEREIIVEGIGFYLSCQEPEKPHLLLSTVWLCGDKRKQLDEFGNFKEPSESVGPAVRHLDLED